MKKSGVRKLLSLMTRSPGILRSGVFLGYCGLKFERRLKVVLLAGTMGVLGSLAAYAGSSSVPLGANIEKTGPAGSVAAQTSTTCLPWDIACLLLRPVGTVPGGHPAGADDRGQDGGLGGGGGGGGGGSSSGGGGSSSSGGDGGKGNNGFGNGGEASQGEPDSGGTGLAGQAEGDPSHSADAGAGAASASGSGGGGKGGGKGGGNGGGGGGNGGGKR